MAIVPIIIKFPAATPIPAQKRMNINLPLAILSSIISKFVPFIKQKKTRPPGTAEEADLGRRKGPGSLDGDRKQ